MSKSFCFCFYQKNHPPFLTYNFALDKQMCLPKEMHSHDKKQNTNYCLTHSKFYFYGTVIESNIFLKWKAGESAGSIQHFE